MAQNIEQERLSRVYKQVFNSETGRTILADLQTQCRASNGQQLFDSSNQHQTAYNCGANWVYRYIQMMIDMRLDESTAQDCITEDIK